MSGSTKHDKDISRRMDALEEQMQSIIKLNDKSLDSFGDLIEIVKKNADFSVWLGNSFVTFASYLLKSMRVISIGLGVLFGVAIANSRIIEIGTEKYLSLSENWQIAMFSAIGTFIITMLGIWLTYLLQRTN